MPTFFEVSEEYLAKLTGDPTEVYRPFLEAGKGDLVPNTDETRGDVLRNLKKAAKKFGYVIKIFIDKKQADHVIFRVENHTFRQNIVVNLSPSPTQSNVAPGTTVNTAPDTDVLPPVVMADIPEDQPTDFEDQQEPDLMSRANGALPKVDPEFDKAWASGEQDNLPGFPPPIFTPDITQNEETIATSATEEPVKIKKERARKRTKAEMEAFRAEQLEKNRIKGAPVVLKKKIDTLVKETMEDLNQQEAELSFALGEYPVTDTTEAPDEPQVTMIVIPEELKTEEHPLVTMEKLAKKKPNRRCPNCGVGYEAARLCPQCAVMTIEITEEEVVTAGA